MDHSHSAIFCAALPEEMAVPKVSSPSPTVFVIDDDPATRDAIALFLGAASLPVKTYESGQKFLEGYEPGWPGCLILDIQMPGMSGLELQRILAGEGIEIPIIFLTGHGDVPMAAEAFKAGAADFIEKPFNDQVLLERIQEAFDQDTELRRQQRVDSGILSRYASLTPRETEVMGQVVKGLSNKKIARLLTVSHRTIDVYRAHVMEKMRAESLPDLVNMASVCCKSNQ